MKKFKETLQKILFPKMPLNIIIAVLSFVFVGIVLGFGLNGSPAAYISYLASTYGLYLVIATILVPCFKKIKNILRRNKYIDMYFSDIIVKSRVSLYKGTSVNVLYAVFKLVSGILVSSYWIIAIAIYYLMLSGIKFTLVGSDVKKIKTRNNDSIILNEWKSYRRVGRLMLFLSITISGIIIQVVRHGKTYTYPGMLIFVYAAYAFYQFISTIVRVIRGRKNKSPIFRAATAIDLCVAVTAIFTLQTAMLTSFSDGGFNKDIFNIPCGIAVVVVILGIAVFMIINSETKIKKLEKGACDNE